ncbi:MAG TPA: magnesium transporter [Candidatus Limnocylindria bacterium]|jgi:magnesium transporter|nr:magnesium transporter [Candidatus Limnocylindria bacterium]
MFAQLLGPEIETFIKERNFAALKECFQEWTPVDTADLIAGLPLEDQVIVFRLLPQNLSGPTFEYLDNDSQHRLIQAMGREETVSILNQMSPDDRTRLLEELPSTAVSELLKLLNPEELKVAKTLLGYPENSVGRLMTPDFIAVRDGWSVQQVLDYVRANGKDRETLNVIFVVDERGRLIDDLRIREFLLRPLDAKVHDFRDDRFISLKVTDSDKSAVELFKKYDRTVLPVIDSEGKIVGIVTVDDVMDVAEREATVEIQKMGGSEALDEPYDTIPFFRMVKKRASWLIILFLGEMLTATAMGYFEEEIEKAVVLALFLPLIISSGGNSGSQASTLIIRAMAVGEVKLSDWWRVMRKEICAGLTLGAILGAIGYFRIAFWSMFSTVYGPHWNLVAITVGGALVGIVLWGTLSGSMLPFLLRRCKIDPATSSAPFVATLVDVTGLIIYFSIAMLVLRSTLLAPPDRDIVKVGQEKAVKAFDHLLNLDSHWQTEEAELHVSANRLSFVVAENEDIGNDLVCTQCGGHGKVVGHEDTKHWPQLPVLKWDAEIISAAPIVKCRKCDQPISVIPPWTTNMPALRRATQ